MNIAVYLSSFIYYDLDMTTTLPQPEDYTPEESEPDSIEVQLYNWPEELNATSIDPFLTLFDAWETEAYKEGDFLDDEDEFDPNAITSTEQKFINLIKQIQDNDAGIANILRDLHLFCFTDTVLTMVKYRNKTPEFQARKLWLAVAKEVRLWDGSDYGSRRSLFEEYRNFTSFPDAKEG